MRTVREVELATDEHVDRRDTCGQCGEPMYYRVDDSGRVTASLCGNITECAAALVEVSE